MTAFADNPPAPSTPPMPDGRSRRRLTVRGQVQGVGFRPFVYRLAREMSVGGFVRNDGAGVTIELQGQPGRLDCFSRRLRSELPPAARIDRLETRPIEWLDQPATDEFRILLSDREQDGRPVRADITVDLPVCDDCLGELFDPADRRFGYPFINCTNCGPRYSIVNDIPYDRATTTMAAFTMCPACQAEYDDPANRRFHAQPNACPACGPKIWPACPTAHRGKRESPNSELRISNSGEVIHQVAQALLAGRIVAIRGLGGFHLAVRADDEKAVQRLRDRKGREHKPLAVMVADLAAAERLAVLADAARDALTGPARPIVIARRRSDARIADAVAPGTGSLGVMLPYTPLHHLLFAELEKQWSVNKSSSTPSTDHWPRNTGHCLPLVMTSGNISDEPILAGNDEALEGLSRVADLFLLHDREIARRIDDSVVEIVGPAVLPLRRARGLVPTGIELQGFCSSACVFAADQEDRDSATPAKARAFAPGIAVGAELKSAVAVVRQVGETGAVAQAILSEHVGDLKDARVYHHFERVIAHLLQITHTVPEWIAHDMHPMYLSSSWARRQGLPLIAVQHHHAHIASCLAEHGQAGPVIGLAADGVGYGGDGSIWGGEILLADLAGFQRLGWFRPIRLPGGDAAAIQTARPAVGWLFDATAGNIPGAWIDRLLPAPAERDIVLKQLSDDFNCPASTAVGRYFDAAAALLGIARENRFEAEAPIALESAIAPGVDDVLPFEINAADNSAPRSAAGPQARASGEARGFQIDLRPALLELIGRVDAGQSPGRLAAAFHNTIASAMAAAADRAGEITGVRTVAASGGVFANRYLCRRIDEQIRQWRGRELLMHRRVPCNDGGIALGQAAVAAGKVASGQWPVVS